MDEGWEEVVEGFLPPPVYREFLKRFGGAEPDAQG